MECNSEVGSSVQTDSSVASSVKYREGIISPEEQTLLQLLERGISETTEENVTFGKEILSLLSKFNLELQSLPSDIREGLQKVASILKFEKLSDLDDVALSIACERKKIEEKKKQYEKMQLSLSYDNIIRKYSSFSRKLNHLQEAVNSLECFVEDTKEEKETAYCNRISLAKRLNEYKQTLETLETDLTDMQIDDLHPQKILNKYHRYLEISGELAQLDHCLNRYKDLPPNLLQAKALLRDKQKEYEALEKEFLEKSF
ncbi:uncharacterized protein LOC122405056 [Colletes gigas]|uniref:uncharacterized protein LOC122405056 n=1 Tax=Colletes gigas TaxID=935657 RepID=UPI001C9A41CF|nr:uncharacterized protein LOC122405056 [Colletes gigas]